MTERTRLEEQLRQGNKLQAIGQLAGGVAHDFNNILTVIISFSELILGELNQENEFVVSGVNEIKQAGLRAAALTKQLLAFSRQQALHLEIVNMNNLVSNLIAMLQRLIGEDMELQTILQPELGSVKADVGQLEQVIVNLVANSRDAMPGGGKITIETSDLQLTENYIFQHAEVQPGNYILLAISDNGIGMEENVQKHIFEPFFTTKEPGKGTGLGLATVHGIIKQLGGYILVYSELQHGTTFKIYLPREEGWSMAENTEPNVSPQGQYSETILLVEDDVTVREVTGHVLRKFGYNVIEASSEEALLSFEQNHERIDLILTDIVMPGINGKELVEILLKRQPELRVLYMSGYSDKRINFQAQDSNNSAFLQKPFTPTLLNQKIRSVLA